MTSVSLVDDHALFPRRGAALAGDRGSAPSTWVGRGGDRRLLPSAGILAVRPDVARRSTSTCPTVAARAIISRSSPVAHGRGLFLALSVSDAADDVVGVDPRRAPGYATKTIDAGSAPSTRSTGSTPATRCSITAPGTVSSSTRSPASAAHAGRPGTRPAGRTTSRR